ncbi:hypothetical protein JG687_00017126 [Phytophthora cactorum]|uniref:Uncharacterized protein n=1 Tax=Phytophthora cactorum TaxID=29920 RepID=A0A8T1TSB0_9STRA|nr:hypothetical protein JG687_00017126 [Phytophthora cactorum]
MTSYEISAHVGLVEAAFVIHNFIRLNKDEFADQGHQQQDEYAGDNDTTGSNHTNAADDISMMHLRDKIATTKVGIDYTVYLAETERWLCKIVTTSFSNSSNIVL